MATVPTSPAEVKPARPSRKPQQRTATLLRSEGHTTLNITEWFVRTVKSTLYHLRVLATDYGFGVELEKFSCEKEPGTYHVHLDAELGDSCDCKGFLRWGHCKHRDCVAELVRRGLLKPAAPAKPAPAPEQVAPYCGPCRSAECAHAAPAVEWDSL